MKFSMLPIIFISCPWTLSNLDTLQRQQVALLALSQRSSLQFTRLVFPAPCPILFRYTWKYFFIFLVFIFKNQIYCQCLQDTNQSRAATLFSLWKTVLNAMKLFRFQKNVALVTDSTKTKELKKVYECWPTSKSISCRLAMSVTRRPLLYSSCASWATISVGGSLSVVPHRISFIACRDFDTSSDAFLPADNGFCF